MYMEKNQALPYPWHPSEGARDSAGLSLFFSGDLEALGACVLCQVTQLLRSRVPQLLQSWCFFPCISLDENKQTNGGMRRVFFSPL